VVEILKDKGFHEILGIMVGFDGENPIQLIEKAGRTAYQSQDKITDDSAKRFITMIIRRDHGSVLEHSAMTVRFSFFSRGMTHEFVRHRLTSPTQESTRYVDESDFFVVIPPTRNPDKKIVELLLPGGKKIQVSFREWMGLNEQMYRALRKAGWPCEDARQVLPIGIKSQITMTANFREWRHIFFLRCARDAHWEIRRAMINLLKDVQKRIPIVFDDFKIRKDKNKGLYAVKI